MLKDIYRYLKSILHNYVQDVEDDDNSSLLEFNKQRANAWKDLISALQTTTYFNHDDDELNSSNFFSK